jgi:hypothetical protein
MNFEAISAAIANTDLFTAVRESQLVYPVVLSTHLTCIAIFGGLILMTDLRLLGVALKGLTISEVVAGTRPWKRLGFVVMVTCGILLGGAKFDTYYDNPYFQVKMALLLLVFVHAMIFRRSVYRNTAALDQAAEIPRVAKIAATVSLVLWLGIMSMGRWIAYYERPEDMPQAPPKVAAHQR